MARIVWIAAAVMLLSSCSTTTRGSVVTSRAPTSNGAVSTPTVSSPAPGTSAPASSEPLVGDASYDDSVIISDATKHAYELDVHLQLGTPVRQRGDDPPGKTAVLLPVKGTVTLTNTGRTYHGGAGGYVVVQLWNMTSPICRSYAPVARRLGALASVKLAIPSGTYCVMPVAVSDEQGRTPTLHPNDEDTTIFESAGIVDPQNDKPSTSFPGGDMVFDGIPDALASDVMTGFASDPALYVLLAPSSSAPVGDTVLPSCLASRQFGSYRVVSSSQHMDCSPH